MTEERITNADALIRKLRRKGIKDPVVSCEVHGTKIKLSEMSEWARIALDAGLDVDAEGTCLLAEQ